MTFMYLNTRSHGTLADKKSEYIRSYQGWAFLSGSSFSQIGHRFLRAEKQQVSNLIAEYIGSTK